MTTETDDATPATDAADRSRRSLSDWLAQRWLRSLIVFLVVCGAGTALAFRLEQPGVFWSDVHVRFLAPPNPTNPNSLQVPEKSLIMTAGTVGQMLDDSDTARTSSPDVHISGLGIRDGEAVILPNSGGQYVYYYTSPYLDLQVVGSSPDDVRTRMIALETRVTSALAKLQDQLKVPAADRIQARVLPLNSAPPVLYEHGSHKRSAIAAIALLVIAGTVTSHLLSRLRHRPRKSNVALVG